VIRWEKILQFLGLTTLFNPWYGCTKVSDGCTHCYAESLMDTRYGKVKWGPTGTRKRTSESNWRQPLKWNRSATEKGERHRVFCASLADVFEDRDELIEWRNDLFITIDMTPQLDWLLLTKRPENIVRLSQDGMPMGLPKNVWLGTSVEDQKTSETRIPRLIEAKSWAESPVAFLSCEPLLGPIELAGESCTHWRFPGVNWLIIGCESGANRREMKWSWASSLVTQCVYADIAVFVKQVEVNGRVVHDVRNFPPSLGFQDFPKVVA
jgi:protein gp37